jgi:hypothetical protein
MELLHQLRWHTANLTSWAQIRIENATTTVKMNTRPPAHARARCGYRL